MNHLRQNNGGQHDNIIFLVIHRDVMNHLRQNNGGQHDNISLPGNT